MKRSRQFFSCLVIILAVTIPVSQIAFALPLTAGTFFPGTIVVPMDDKQADRIHVYGFIHEFLRNNPGSAVARVIEPPNVILQTDLTPAGVVYQGGPFFIDSSFTSAVNVMLANATFSQVTITRLTTTFSSSRIFFVRQPTRILVISDGYWGKTFLTLGRMGISYTQVSTAQVLVDPSMINQYSLIVLDSPGWYGNPSAYTPFQRSQIGAVYNTIQSRVSAGNEVMYTDVAMFDLNSTFPGYIQLGNPGETGSWNGMMHNPPLGDSGFDSEFPSQYYNPGPNPSQLTIFTEEGVGNWVPNGVLQGHAADVRILMDSTNYGIPKLPYSILAFYFPFGNGIVEGLALQPYEQLYPKYADYNGYYAVYQIYGNKFVEGLSPDFSLTASPPSVTVPLAQAASYQLTVSSINSFSGTINLQISGLPTGAEAVLVPSGSVSLDQGQSVTETLRVLVTQSTPLGSYNLTITGIARNVVVGLSQTAHNLVVGLVVSVPVADFGLALSPSQLYVSGGACGNITLTVKSIGGFSSAVRLNLTGLPDQVSSLFTPNPTTPTAGTVQSILTLCPATTATPGNYTMVIAGTSGSTVHTVDATLSISPPPPPPPFNGLIVWFVIGMLSLGLGLALLVVALSKRRETRSLKHTKTNMSTQ